jgi:hypothetical protein
MNRASAIFAQQPGFLLVGGVIPLEFIFGAMAAFADDERLALFDPGHRNEKNLKIMIDALVIGLVQTANRTTPGLFVQNLRLWGYAEDKEHSQGSQVYPHAKAHKLSAAPKATTVQGLSAYGGFKGSGLRLPVQPVL